VTDWRLQNNTEPIPRLRKVIQEGFGPAYRFNARDWRKLQAGKFFNPSLFRGDFDREKLILVHAADDPIVKFSQSQAFCEKHELPLLALHGGGHLSVSDILDPKVSSQILRFLR